MATHNLSEAVLEVLSQNANTGIWVCSAKGIIEWCNAACEVQSGFSLEELQSTSYAEFLTSICATSEKEEEFLRAFQSHAKAIVELELHHKSSHTYWAELDTQPLTVKGTEYICVYQRIISTKVKEQEQLQELEMRYRHFFEHSFLGISILDEKMTIIDCNTREAAMLGYDRKQLFGKNILDFVMPAYRKHKREMHHKLFLGEVEDFYITEERIHKSGTPLWVSVSSTKLVLPRSNKVLRVNFTRDIHKEVLERKEYDVLRQNIDRLIEALPLPVFIKDDAHKWVNVNSAFCSLTGLERLSLLGKTDYDFFPKEQAAIFHEKDREVLNTDSVSVNQELLTNARGEVRTLLTYKHPYNTLDGKRHLIGIISDITELLHKDELLAESKLQLECMLDSTMHAFILLDQEQCILAFNKKAEEENLIAFSVQLKLGMHFPPSNAPQEVQAGFQQLFAEAMEGKQVQLTTDSIIQGYENQYFEVQFLPVRSKEGAIIGVTYSSINATERIQAERRLTESESLLKSINYNIQEGIYRSIYEGRLLYVNKAFAEMFGYGSVDEVLTLPSLSLYVNPDRRKELAEQLLRDGIFKNEEVLFKRKDGSTFWVLLSSNLSVDDDGRKVFNGAVRDMTAIKRVQQELVAAKESAEELNRLKSNFLANMSHEIRTPINGILGLADIIDQSVTDQELKYLVQLQRDSGRRLLDTISSILNLSKLEAEGASLQLRPIEINALIADHLQPHLHMAAKKGIVLEVHTANEPLFVLADESVLHQILNNLLGNAIKFTEEGSITISTGIILNRKGETLVEWIVHDTGVGISEQFLPHIFSPFEQESSGHKRRFEGNGLGLSITKKYIELLGGSIFVESKKQVGSTFKVHLPLYPHSISS